MLRGELCFSFCYGFFIRHFADHYIGYRFRVDPVPGVHKSCMKYKYFQHPGTYAERRDWYAAEGLGRRKRSPRLLPTNWDDYGRSNINRTWKNNKFKRQWMKNH